MLIRALNEPELSHSSSEESSSEDGRPQILTKEASEEQFFDKYRESLVYIKDLRYEEARDTLETLYHDLKKLKNCQEDTNLTHLKYSVLKNLGLVCNDEIQYYIEALEIDASDVTLWLKTGDRGLKLNNTLLARHCYEQALAISPKNLIAIDRLLELYYILHLPCELADICFRAIDLQPNHKKASILIKEADEMQPFTKQFKDSSKKSLVKNDVACELLLRLDSVKRLRREDIKIEMQGIKKQKLSITLDTSRTQSLSSFGNYIIKIYERFARFGITKNTTIDINIHTSTLSISQQLSTNVESQTNNQSSNEVQPSVSQDIEMDVDGEFATSVSDSEKSGKNEPGTSSDNTEQPKCNNKNSKSKNSNKPSLASFASLLFPNDATDKRRSSRNRAATQDDSINVKVKFTELNDLLPDELRMAAIETLLNQNEEVSQSSRDAVISSSGKMKDEPTAVDSNLVPMREDLIIKEVVNAVLHKIQLDQLDGHNLKLCDLFFMFLSKLADKKQNLLPDVFTKVYRIYRQICSFPSGVFIDIGSEGITIDELWLTLTANEISYKANECQFLLRLLGQLELHLDESQYREFLVRFFVILGENYHISYLEEVLNNIEEDTKIYASNRKTITRAFIKTLIDIKNEEKMHAIDETDNATELIEKLAPKSENEMSEREVAALCFAIISTCIWQRGIDILNQRSDFSLDVIIDTINECLKNGAKLDAILASKLCKEAVINPRPRVWMCLYRGWCNLLTQDQLEEEKTVSDMDKFFAIGHQTLGKKTNCTADGGEFLMAYVKHLIDERDNYDERDVYGALSCLFNFPNKKPVSVIHHKATNVPMVWDCANTVYQFIYPAEMPTYMSLLRKAGISNECEQLMREIVNTVPLEFNPEREVCIINDYIEEGCKLSESSIVKVDVTEDIYYLLADYYFKNKDFQKAKQFYALDLVLNPERFDSWAASALIRANEIDRKLSDGTIETRSLIDGKINDCINSAMRCFNQATKLQPNEKNGTLWIEYGNLTYNLSSLAKRLHSLREFGKNLNNLTSDTSDTTQRLKDIHLNLLNKASDCFNSANVLCDSKEVWLHYYMFGKIAEKTIPIKALEYYLKADAQLFVEGATYPRKISYHSPPDFAYEAMEVHYRIHCAALKFLCSCSNPTRKQLKRIHSYLLRAHRSPFVEYEGHNDPHSVSKIANVESSVQSLLEDLCEDVSMQIVNFDELIYMCLDGLKRCIVRCDKNFKALYRLAQYYFITNDTEMAKSVLLAKEIAVDKRAQELLSRQPDIRRHWRSAPPDLRNIDSLFKDRRQGNFYCNIWRIPVEEVDRPGSFEHWMYRCTHLLICVCAQLEDASMLSTIAFQLSREPETSKKYLHDAARVLLADFAVKSMPAKTN